MLEKSNNMFSVKLTEPELEIYKKYVKEHFPLSRMAQFPSFRQFGARDADPNALGIAGEVAVNKFLGKPVADALRDRPTFQDDGGVDVTIAGLTFDIKTHPSFYLEQMINKDEKTSYGYILVNTVDMREYHIIGWVERAALPKLASFHKKGERKNERFTYPCDTWLIPTPSLRFWGEGGPDLTTIK